MGQPLYYMTRTATGTDGTSYTTVLSDVVPQGYSSTHQSSDGTITYTDSASTFGVFDTVSSIVRDGFVNNGSYGLGGGGSGAAATMLEKVMNVGTNAAAAYFGSANPIGSGVSYILKSDRFNLAAGIKASKNE